MNDIFENYQPEEAFFVLRQTFADSGKTLFKGEIKGKGKDIIHMFVLALKANRKKGGDLHKIIADALQVEGGK